MIDREPCYTESDWKLFRKRLPEWQEAYIEKLIRKYLALLSKNTNPTDRFWKLEQMITIDKKDPGVILTDICRSRLAMHLKRLYAGGIITDK